MIWILFRVPNFEKRLKKIWAALESSTKKNAFIGFQVNSRRLRIGKKVSINEMRNHFSQLAYRVENAKNSIGMEIYGNTVSASFKIEMYLIILERGWGEEY